MIGLKHDRKSYIPAGALKITDKNSDAVAYILYRPRKKTGEMVHHVVAFCGKRQKPDLNFIYRSEKARDQAVAGYFKSRRGSLESTALRRADRTAQANRLEVGTVLTGSWGYDQTNVEAWQVVELVGKMTVKLRKVALTNAGGEGGSAMSEMVIPCPDQFAGDEVVTKRVKYGNCVSLDHCSLSPWEGRPLYSSWYA
jgi:hypothetical protein